MEPISLIVLTILSIITAVYGYFKYSFNYWKSRNVPHDEPSIPLGNIKDYGKTVHQSIFFKRLYDKYKPTGEKLCGVYFLARPLAVIMDLDLIKSILVKDFVNFDERGLYYNEGDDPMSAHLFQVDGTKWKKLRAKLTPTFTSGKMKFMFPTVIEVADRFHNSLTEVVQEGVQLEMKELLSRFTTDVIGTCAFGIECNSLKDPNTDFRRHGQEAFSKPRHSAVIASFLHGFKNVGRQLHIKWVPHDVAEFFMSVVRDTVEYREKNNITRNDFMDLLIKLKNEESNDKDKILTLNEIAAQAYVFFAAGFETSSTTLTFCLYELCMNPEIQSKARKIIKEAYKKHGQFTYEMMMDIPYIDQLLEETMRKYPPIANLMRETQNDYTVPGADQVIEKGTTCIIPTFAIHRDPEIYPELEKFDPERFSKEDKTTRDPMAWLSFGTGPRNCIGLRFGMMQARIGLVTLLNNFEFSLGSETITPLVFEPVPLVLAPIGGLYLYLKPIKS